MCFVALVDSGESFSAKLDRLHFTWPRENMVGVNMVLA